MFQEKTAVPEFRAHLEHPVRLDRVANEGSKAKLVNRGYRDLPESVVTPEWRDKMVHVERPEKRELKDIRDLLGSW